MGVRGGVSVVLLPLLIKGLRHQVGEILGSEK